MLRKVTALFLGIVLLSLMGCKAGVPKVTGIRSPASSNSGKPTSSTKVNFAAAGTGGTTVAAVSGVKIKFTLGYNQMGPKVGSASGNIRPSSAGVMNER